LKKGKNKMEGLDWTFNFFISKFISSLITLQNTTNLPSLGEVGRTLKNNQW
jgi:hypothetical protein